MGEGMHLRDPLARAQGLCGWRPALPPATGRRRGRPPQAQESSSPLPHKDTRPPTALQATGRQRRKAGLVSSSRATVTRIKNCCHAKQTMAQIMRGTCETPSPERREPRTRHHPFTATEGGKALAVAPSRASRPGRNSGARCYTIRSNTKNHAMPKASSKAQGIKSRRQAEARSTPKNWQDRMKHTCRGETMTPTNPANRPRVR